jgi:5,6-dimethylbenzimidazole synthase
MNPQSQYAFSESAKQSFYSAVYGRRDVRNQFLSTPIDESALMRVLNAAHHAPSVGFSQPWDFIIIRDQGTRQRVKASYTVEHTKASELYEGERQDQYRSLKLEGILDAPINLCVTCDRTRTGPNVLGRNTIVDSDLFSTCLAVQNLWLAARVEGIGVGWVSILDPKLLSELLELPSSVVPLAYLCLGYVTEFLEQPELEQLHWQSRFPLAKHIHYETWSRSA